jgi:hypothetical protein
MKIQDLFSFFCLTESLGYFFQELKKLDLMLEKTAGRQSSRSSVPSEENGLSLSYQLDAE